MSKTFPVIYFYFCVDKNRHLFQPQPDLNRHIYFRSILISLSHSCQCPQSFFFLSGFRSKILYDVVFSHMHSTRPIHFKLRDLFTQQYSVRSISHEATRSAFSPVSCYSCLCTLLRTSQQLQPVLFPACLPTADVQQDVDTVRCQTAVTQRKGDIVRFCIINTDIAHVGRVE